MSATNNRISAQDNVFMAQNGQIVIEAESVTPVGAWEEVAVDNEIGLLFDPVQSGLDGPSSGQTLSYHFRTDEAATYRIGLRSGRISSAYDTMDPGGDPRNNGDTRNNDVYVSIINAETNEVVQAPTRLFTGLNKNSSGQLWWGNQFDPSNGGEESWRGTKRSQVELEANTEYRLELTGRSDGYVVDQITLRSDSHLNNTDAHRAPKPGSEEPPNLPYSSIADVDLSQYKDMEEWSKAGVDGGIPDDLTIVKTISPGDDIQSAIQEVNVAGGGVLLLKQGTYVVDDEITMADNVVVRGENRESTRVEFTYTGSTGRSLFAFWETQNAGLENITLEYIAPDGLKPETGNYSKLRDDLKTNLVRIRGRSDNNWVKSVTALNAGGDPFVIEGNNNTLTDNYVEGAYNKHGGSGYYRIAGARNLIKGETVKDLRHFGILTRRANYNVVVDSYFETDINFHIGDTGSNLIEGNTINIPSYHGWSAFSTGGPLFAHLPPGSDNLVVNNLVLQNRKNPADSDSRFSQENVVYRFEGYGTPVATNIQVPEGGRFYVPAYASTISPEPTTDQPLLSFSLINAETDQVMAGYENLAIDSIVDLEGLELDTFNIVAKVNPDHPDASTVKSIKFESSLGDRIENFKPYALFADKDNGADFYGRPLSLGNFTLNATAYTEANGEGQLVEAVTTTYEFVNNAPIANRAPIAQDDSFITDKALAIVGNVFEDQGNGSDSDVDINDTFTVTAINEISGSVGNSMTLASGALLTMNADGSLNYDPNNQFDTLDSGQSASDSFTYTISDSQGAMDTATVNVTINGSNNPTSGRPENDLLVGIPGNDSRTGTANNNMPPAPTEPVNPVPSNPAPVIPVEPAPVTPAPAEPPAPILLMPEPYTPPEMSKIPTKDVTLPAVPSPETTPEALASDANNTSEDAAEEVPLEVEAEILEFVDSVGNGPDTSDGLSGSEADMATSVASITDNLIDLRTVDLNQDGQVDEQVEITIADIISSAGYDNAVGFYEVANASGAIIDQLTGQLIQPEDEGYAATALRQHLRGVEVLRDSGTLGFSASGGNLLGAFLIADGTLAEMMTQNPTNQADGDLHAYFAAQGANPDGAAHVRALGSDRLGFEDLWGGGDNDFNDFMFNVGMSRPIG